MRKRVRGNLNSSSKDHNSYKLYLISSEMDIIISKANFKFILLKIIEKLLPFAADPMTPAACSSLLKHKCLSLTLPAALQTLQTRKSSAESFDARAEHRSASGE